MAMPIVFVSSLDAFAIEQKLYSHKTEHRYYSALHRKSVSASALGVWALLHGGSWIAPPCHKAHSWEQHVSFLSHSTSRTQAQLLTE